MPKLSPEVKKAIETRDALLADVEKAIEKVDELKDDLLRQYQAAQDQYQVAQEGR